ncbi:aldose epimerase family protein [Kitasatospora sp. NPDC058965]|uniref:aldose epimerase family protein n=1 Tax=Kitasatospora sp. NPDC058965 TaxID=3346682 RepID=UPI00367D7012
MSQQTPTVHAVGTDTLPDGRTSTRWLLAAPDGLTVELHDFGARLHAVRAPDRAGRLDDVLLGPVGWDQFFGEGAYFGSTVGRYGNRIAGGRLRIGGTEYQLATQAGGHTLHGGPDGFATRVWTGEPLQSADRAGVVFRLTSPDGDQGFPGTLDVEVSYLLSADGELAIHYAAVSDAPTVVNLTNHAYVNLGGPASRTVADHLLRVAAEQYLPVDPGMIPLGPPAPVAGTPFDLAEPTRLGDRLDLDHPQLLLAGGGFDHTWVLPTAAGEELRPVAVLDHPPTGRRLEVRTTEPGLQVYTANHFDGSIGPAGAGYGRHAGVALETQHYPDSPNRDAYPTTLVAAGERYRSTTVYRFGVQG